MADTPLELQDFTQVMKTVYLPIRKKAFKIMTPLLANSRRMGPKEVKYSGHDLVFDVKFGRRPGFVSSARGYFPRSKMAREKQGRLSIARSYARASIDGLALKATQGDKASYISAAAKVVEDLQEQWQLEQNRVLQGDSLGIRAAVTSVTDTTHIEVESPYGIASSGPGNLHLEVDEDIAVLTAAGVQRGKATISAISLSGDTATLTLSAAIASMAATDVVVSAPPTAIHSTDNSWGAEPHGIKSIIDVEGAFATFEGIADDRWVAQKMTSSTVDEMILMKLLNTIRARAGIDWRQDPSKLLLMTTTGIWTSYGESLLGLRRYDAPTYEIQGGFKGVGVGGGTLIDDPWGPRGRVYAIHGPDTVFIDLMDWGKLAYQDSPVWQRATDRDAWEAPYGVYWNFGCLLRASHGVISSVTDTVNYSPIY
jgi:hypothetical protein